MGDLALNSIGVFSAKPWMFSWFGSLSNIVFKIPILACPAAKCIGKSCDAPKIGPTKPPPEPPRETPKTDVPKTPDVQPECPTEIQRLKEPVGEVIGDERVVKHRLVQNGNTF